MAIREFPPVELSDQYGLLAVGGDLEVSSLVLAYRNGIFPWPYDARYPAWFSPPRRAVLFVRDFHISKSLRKTINRAAHTIEIDRRFKEVINACAEMKNRGKQAGTWINTSMIEAYIALHKAGYAHSIECCFDGVLVGGLYGVSISGMFAGESMFYRKPDASKLALAFLVEYLGARGIEWIDCQVMTPFLKSMGAREIARDEFIELLRSALRKRTALFQNKTQ